MKVIAKPPIDRAFKENPQKLLETRSLFDVQKIDDALANGIAGSSSLSVYHRQYSWCRVELCPGKTREDLTVFVSRLKDCPIWDAMLAAENAGIVKVVPAGSKSEVREKQGL
jgi:hypothetical protein